MRQTGKHPLSLYSMTKEELAFHVTGQPRADYRTIADLAVDRITHLCEHHFTDVLEHEYSSVLTSIRYTCDSKSGLLLYPYYHCQRIARLVHAIDMTIRFYSDPFINALEQQHCASCLIRLAEMLNSFSIKKKSPPKG